MLEVVGTKVDENLKYTKTSEWIRVEGDVGIIGFTDYAQNELTDIVFVELPEVGAETTQNEPCAVVESVKTAADFYAPVSGEVVEINEALMDNPEKINEDPFGEGWVAKIKFTDAGELDNLLDANAYVAHIDETHGKH